jgi:hypothetical protein
MLSKQPAGAPSCQAWSNTKTTKTEIPLFLNFEYFFSFSSSFSPSVCLVHCLLVHHLFL